MTETLYVGGATGYDEMFARMTEAFIPALLEAARMAPGQRILDVATGTGLAARAARDMVGPGGKVTAGDISATMLDVARRNEKNSGINFEQFDGHRLPYPEADFDRVICQLGLAFFDDPGRGLTEFRRVLKPDGRAAVTVNSTPERSMFTRIGTVIAQQVPERPEQLNRYASIRSTERLRELFVGRRISGRGSQDRNEVLLVYVIRRLFQRHGGGSRHCRPGLPAVRTMEECANYQRNRTVTRRVQATDQDPNRVALGRHCRDVVLGFARLRPDQHAQSRWMENNRRKAYRSGN
jgi:ubiquinone/menaquinone biosynthesis C-methylase UbiE